MYEFSINDPIRKAAQKVLNESFFDENGSRAVRKFIVKLPDNRIVASEDTVGWVADTPIEDRLESYAAQTYGDDFAGMCKVMSEPELEARGLNPSNERDWMDGAKTCRLCGRIFPSEEYVDGTDYCLSCTKTKSDANESVEAEEDIFDGLTESEIDEADAILRSPLRPKRGYGHEENGTVQSDDFSDDTSTLDGLINARGKADALRGHYVERGRKYDDAKRQVAELERIRETLGKIGEVYEAERYVQKAIDALNYYLEDQGGDYEDNLAKMSAKVNGPYHVKTTRSGRSVASQQPL